MTSQKNTPMMEQYLSIKKNYPDAVLFYRMGDFYEMFLEDAVKASAILEIALTSRNKNQEDPVPMCGIPFRAADSYIAKLIENGCKVAICEQVEDPAAAKGLVRREVTRVVTPGMILNESLLDRSSNNYLLSLSILEGYAGMAWLDISTGLFITTQSSTVNGKVPDELLDEAMRVAPSEFLLPDHFRNDPAFNYIRKRFPSNGITWLERRNFRMPDARNRLIEHFSTRSLKGFGCDHLTAALSAAGAIMAYVHETQLQDTNHITSLDYHDMKSYLVMDERSCRNLEIFKNIENGGKSGTLVTILDNTVTAMGARLLKNWLRYPLKDRDSIENRLDAVDDAINQKSIRNSLRSSLKSVYDLERLGSRISMGHGTPRDMLALKTSLLKLPEIFKDLNRLSAPLYKGEFIENKEDVARDLTQLATIIDRAVRDDAPLATGEGGIIKDGYSSELDELIELSRNGKKWILDKGIQEKEKTGLSSLKIKYNKVFGYFIELSRTQASSAPEHYIRKQTLVNAERFITEELKEMESKILNAQEKRASLEYDIFCDVKKEIVQKTESIMKMANFLATVDVLTCFAHTSELNSYVRPKIVDSNLFIKDGRHPVVEKLIEGERYVPNSVELNDEDQQLLIITGPNMAGKSTVLRQVALQVLMAQTGCFVPASKAEIPVTDRIFTRVGALDNLAQGQSTFMVEMEETANIINNATPQSLVILDEIGRGTSTFDGLSIAWAVAEHLHDLNGGEGVKTLFATHYHELTRLEHLKPRVKNYNIAVKEFDDNIIFLRSLVPGATNKSYGIQVAKLAGIPDKVVLRAGEILRTIEHQGDLLDSSNIVEEKDLHIDVVGKAKSKSNSKSKSSSKSQSSSKSESSSKSKTSSKSKSNLKLGKNDEAVSEQMDLFY
ncbi:DNA mismatch repair protein mutS [Desulfamplus magnetovallimortis]|uniref:DNA mismatch repair protein MutS n=1 Tax=Desulfamplus magnetovallimortis TaxID=1246637 RepID=A0A1W1HC42_9BACT|nr:DNA mismatch repair protein MutS [Desulfamplus magnetovallimortis]SLM30013.1 DNA mismatch repair protein mutS [Desulfamplus magnetovallimortis]